MKKISIIIPVFKGVDIRLTELCVKSLKENSKEDHEIILVINPAENLEEIKLYCNFGATKVLFNEEQGQCKANNLGVKLASNDWIMIADNDNVFPKNWEKCLEHLQPDTVLTLNSMEYNPRGSLPGCITCDCGTIDKFDKEKFEEEAEKNSKDTFIPGFIYPFIMEKKHYLAIDGFDEGYDPWGNTCDSDFRYKLMLYGLELKRYNGVVCYHFSQQIAWTYQNDADSDYHLKGNRRYFENKWQLAQAPSPQIWYSEFVIPLEKVGYKPEWTGKISNKWLGKEENNQYWECPGCRYHNFNFRNNCLRCSYDKPNK